MKNTLKTLGFATMVTVGMIVAAAGTQRALADDAVGASGFNFTDGRLTIDVDAAVAADPEKAARIKEYEVPAELGRYAGIYLKKLKLRDSVAVKVTITDFRLRSGGNVAFSGLMSGKDYINGTVVFEENGQQLKVAPVESSGYGGYTGKGRVEDMAKEFGKNLYQEARTLR